MYVYKICSYKYYQKYLFLLSSIQIVLKNCSVQIFICIHTNTNTNYYSVYNTNTNNPKPLFIGKIGANELIIIYQAIQIQYGQMTIWPAL